MNAVVQPSITFLNMTGDVTITWDETNKDAIVRLVEAKMKEGYSFFILKPRIGGLLGHKKVALTKVSQLKKAGALVVPDEVVQAVMPKLEDPAVETVVSQGQAAVVPFPGGSTSNLDTQGRAKTAEQVIQNQTVAVKRVVGG